MAARRPRNKPGGIYELKPPERIPVNTTEGFKQLRDWVTKYNDMIGYLRQLREQSLTLLEPYRAKMPVAWDEEKDVPIMKVQSSAIFPHLLPPRANLQAWLARDIVRRCDSLLACLKPGVSNQALLREGFVLGRLAEQVEVLQLDKLVRKQLSVGKAARQRRAELKRAQGDEMLAHLRKCRHQFKSTSQAREHIAEQFGVHPRTVLRHEKRRSKKKNQNSSDTLTKRH